MPKYRLSQHSMDVIFKLEAQQLGAALARRFGIDLPRLAARMKRGAGLTPEARLDLIFLPLMRHQRARREVVVDTVALARQLPERQQRQALASLIGLGHRFLTDAELDTLLEGLMSTNVGQRLIERGVEQGRQEGIA